jgi:hypothetical protein
MTISISITLEDIISLLDLSLVNQSDRSFRDVYASELLRQCPELLQQKVPTYIQYIQSLQASVAGFVLPTLHESLLKRFYAQVPEITTDEAILAHLRTRSANYILGCSKKRCSTCLALIRHVTLTPCNHGGKPCYGGRGVHLTTRRLQTVHQTGEIDEYSGSSEVMDTEPLLTEVPVPQTEGLQNDTAVSTDLRLTNDLGTSVHCFGVTQTGPSLPSVAEESISSGHDSVDSFGEPKPNLIERLARYTKYDHELQKLLNELFKASTKNRKLGSKYTDATKRLVAANARRTKF